MFFSEELTDSESEDNDGGYDDGEENDDDDDHDHSDEDNVDENQDREDHEGNDVCKGCGDIQHKHEKITEKEFNNDGCKVQNDEKGACGGRHDDVHSDHNVYEEKLLSQQKKFDLSSEDSSLDITQTIGRVRLEDR